MAHAHGNEAAMAASNEIVGVLQNYQYSCGKGVNEDTLASCSRTLNASFEKALELSAVNISTDTSPTEQSSNMSLPSVRQITKDFEEKRRMLLHYNNGKPLSPILKKNEEPSPPPRSDNNSKTGQTACITPPKIVRKDNAGRVLTPQATAATANNNFVMEKDLFDTPEKHMLSPAPLPSFQYDTPPQKKLFADDDDNADNGVVAGYFSHWIPSSSEVVHEVDTPKTCNTSNFSTSFTVSQIAFDPNKTNSCVDPEESFETFYSEDGDSNRRRSYFDDTFDSIQEKDLPNCRRKSPKTIYKRVERVFFSHVDTLVDKFVMACVQEKDVPGVKSNNKMAKSTPNEGLQGEKGEQKVDNSHQPRVMAV